MFHYVCYSQNFLLSLETLPDQCCHIGRLTDGILSCLICIRRNTWIFFLGECVPNMGVRDCHTWEWDPKWVLSVRNAYYRLNDGGLRWAFTKVIWKVKAPLKVMAFIWFPIYRMILTWDNIMKRRWQWSSVCVLCKTEEESVNHLFLVCPFSVGIGDRLARCLRLHLPQLPTTVNFFGSLGDA